jgi:DNA anti-recombination protein RmuC
VIDDELRQILAEMRQDTAEVRQEMRQGFAHSRQELAELRQELADTRAEMRRHFDVTIERMDKKFDLVVEMVMNVDQKLDRESASIRGEMRDGFAETNNLIRFIAQGR